MLERHNRKLTAKYAAMVRDEVRSAEYGTDGEYFAIISGGSDAKKAIGRPGLADGGMEAFGSQIPPDGIWRIVSYIRAQQHHEGSESPATEKLEHETGGKH